MSIYGILFCFQEKILTLLTNWVAMEAIMLSEINQEMYDKYCVMSRIFGNQIAKDKEGEIQTVPEGKKIRKKKSLIGN